LHLVGGDALHDRGAALLPAVDPLDVVPAQPLLVGPARAAVGTDVAGDAGHVVVRQRRALLRDLRELAIELRLLGAEEPDIAREEPRVAPVRDHDLDLALRVTAEPRDDAELE